jgi:glycosyltransferase involved in cell wall biosynthesis
MSELTTFVMPSINRPTVQRAIDSVERTGAFILWREDKNNLGPGELRNRLIKRVKTPWVSFIDDDDTVIEDYVQRLAEEIEKNPEADLIHFKTYFPWGQVLPQWPTVGWGNIGISFSVKTQVAKNFPFKDEPYEDYEFVHRLERMGHNIVFSPYLTYRARH